VRVIRGIQQNSKILAGCVATIGNFDGMHLGHRSIVDKLKVVAKQENLPSLVITFEPQPEEFFSHAKCPPRLTKFREKLEQLQEMGVDCVAVLCFDERLAVMSAQEFADQILLKQFVVKHLVVGDDFHFGKDKAGDFEFLRKLGLQVSRCRGVEVSKHRISSTLIRNVLECGDFELAAKLLGRPFLMSGKVVHGDKLGRNIGFPTANIYLHRKKSPIAGVFAVRVLGLGKKPIVGVANIGTRPTVKGTRPILEVHLFDFNRDIYGRHVQVEFLHKIRDEKHFASFDLLKQQIDSDTQEARVFLIRHRARLGANI
jgi:riboflavin kinase / FMN adenylyltransferase